MKFRVLNSYDSYNLFSLTAEPRLNHLIFCTYTLCHIKLYKVRSVKSDRELSPIPVGNPNILYIERATRSG